MYINTSRIGIFACRSASVHTVRSDPFPSDNLHSVQVSANRLRRKVGGYTVPGPLEYLKAIREQLENDEETNATSVWGLLDRDVVQGNYKPGPSNGKCTLAQSFHFPLKALIKVHSFRNNISEADNSGIPLTRATLRAYIQTIPRHLPEPGDNFTVNVEVLTAIVNQANVSTTPSILQQSKPLL